ncbi:MAG: S8 family serine peptidase [Promethearchaeota archaeon]
MTYLDSFLTQNYTNSIPNTFPIKGDISEETERDLQTNIITWSELLNNNPYLLNLNNIISYSESALVKVREDEKIEFIVKKDSMEFSSQARELLSEYNVEFFEEISGFNANIVYISLSILDEFINKAKSTPGIAYIEPNFYIELDFVPNDEYYASDLWALPLIGMESAWDHELGSHDIVVAVVDTGIDYTHPDLSENYVSLGYDWVNDDNDPKDDHYHGTHCAGTIAAVINNEIGVTGLANVSIFAEKAFNAIGSGSHESTSSAIRHAVDMGADIISCSWGGTSYSELLYDAIKYAVENGVLVIAAAGNSDSDDLHYPAAYPEVIAVSATDQNDDKATFSNFGDWVDISAPGVDIMSTVPYYTRGTYYMLASGTSMATPHVSGFAALLKSAYPTKSAIEIEALIYDSALDLGDIGFDPVFGNGRIDGTTIFGPDNAPPSFSNLIESADPIELGNTEVISIDVIDPSGVNQVIIEFEGSNHSMVNIGGITWQYDAWIPLSIGNYTYTIYMGDNNNNWGSVSGSIRVVEKGSDITPPTYSNLIESADPLKLGKTEVISIDVTDQSGVNKVNIEFEGLTHSMINIGGDTWQYDSWTPSSPGTYTYTIYMEDNYENLASVSGSISVIDGSSDTTPPTLVKLTESADPLELGNKELIFADVIDDSGVNQVLIEFEGSNHSMRRIGGNVWLYDSWIPSSIGIYPYTIHMEDIFNNWGSVSDSIEVIEGDSDTTPPTYSNLIESADPLELGNTEVISIDVTDPSGINQVRIEFEESVYSMTNIGGDTWQYNSWTPSSIGIYPYTISMEDNNNNWGFVSDSIQVIEGGSDITPPTYSNLIENADPLELGNTEIILIDVTDPSGINQVLIKIEGLTHSMINIGGDTWQYNSWIPSNTGLFPYTIYMEDNNNNWNYVSDSIQVLDTNPPTCIILTNNTTPLELGNSKLIMVKARDISGINQVLIEYEGLTDYLTNLGGDVWQYKDFFPSNIGNCIYTIKIEDNNNNWNSTSASIEVRDTIAPNAPLLIDYPWGEVKGKIIFNWEDGIDPSGILYYRLIIDNESNPLITPGNIFEIEIENLGSESSYFELEEPLALGTYYFFLYQTDGSGHESPSTTGTFTVVSFSNVNKDQFSAIKFLWWVLAIGAVLSVPSISIVAIKRIKNGKSKFNMDNFEIKNLKGELKDLVNRKKQLQKAAETSIRYGNYTKAAELYKTCEDISNEIFKNGNITEAEKTKYYANMRHKAFQAIERKDSFVNFQINEFLTKYFDNIGIKYYSYPQIYNNGQRALNGWILNHTKFLQHRLSNPKNGLELVRELGINPGIISHITAIQFVFTNNLSYDSIIDICMSHQGQNIFMFIMGTKWPSTFHNHRSFMPPENVETINRENIRIINYSLLADFIGLENKNKKLFLQNFF